MIQKISYQTEILSERTKKSLEDLLPIQILQNKFKFAFPKGWYKLDSYLLSSLNVHVVNYDHFGFYASVRIPTEKKSLALTWRTDILLQNPSMYFESGICTYIGLVII